MLPELTFLAHATPTWLMNLNPSDIQKGPGPWMKHLVEDALVYPGSGLDGSPVRQCNGAVHSFVYLDYGTRKAQVVTEMKRQRKTGTGFAHHHLVGMTEFDPTPLMADANPAFIHPGENIHQTQAPYGIWAVYESIATGPIERFSFLFLGVEAIQALAALYPTTPPRGMVIQEHGFSGNVWSSFSEQVLSLSENWSGVPEILILGPNHRLDKWNRKAQLRCVDIATEAMHQEEREVLWMNAPERILRGREELTLA
jgi:hypothetical protein